MHHLYRFVSLCLCLAGVAALEIGQGSTPVHRRKHSELPSVRLSLDALGSKGFAGRPKPGAAESSEGGVASEDSTFPMYEPSSGEVLVTSLVVWIIIAACLLHGPWQAGSAPYDGALVMEKGQVGLPKQLSPPSSGAAVGGGGAKEAERPEAAKIGAAFVYEEVVKPDKSQMPGFAAQGQSMQQGFPVATTGSMDGQGFAMEAAQQQALSLQAAHAGSPMQQGVVLQQVQERAAQDQASWQESVYEVNASSSDEPFAFRYPELSAQDQRAIKLLLKCNIISKDELESNCVSQEHLAECLSIGNQMLELKSLEEWVTLSQYGRQSFQATVADIFETRENARAAISQARENPTGGAMEYTFRGEHQSGPMTASSLARGSQSASVVSTISFGQDLASRQSIPPTDPLLKLFKSPVPLLNCFDRVDAVPPSPSQGGSAQSLQSQEEPGFASVLPPTIPHAPASPILKFVSLQSQEIITAPPAGWTVVPGSGTGTSSLRLSAQEVMAPPPDMRIPADLSPSVSQAASLQLPAQEVVAAPLDMRAAAERSPTVSRSGSLRLPAREVMAVPPDPFAADMSSSESQSSSMRQDAIAPPVHAAVAPEKSPSGSLRLPAREVMAPSPDMLVPAERSPAVSQSSSMRLPAREVMTAQPDPKSREKHWLEQARLDGVTLDQAVSDMVAAAEKPTTEEEEEEAVIEESEIYRDEALAAVSESPWADRERAEEELIAAEERERAEQELIAAEEELIAAQRASAA